MESFDPKPQLTKHAGKTIEESPWGDKVLKSPFYRKNVRDFAGTLRNLMPKLYPLQVGFRKRGESGIEVSDWWPHLSECVDDLSVVRSMWTTDNDHAAQLQFHTGRHIFDGFYPAVGAWVHYGLGTLNENLPQFIVQLPGNGGALFFLIGTALFVYYGAADRYVGVATCDLDELLQYLESCPVV